jgi:glucitol/sorbitol PTS system EIIB component
VTEYKAVTIEKGRGGWGGPLTVKPTAERNLIYSVTGGGIHPVAARIAELTGGEAFDGFRSSAPFDKIACAVIDCGGTARVGVYPMKKVPTVDVHPTSPAGPLAMFIKEELFVSGVKPENVRQVAGR